MVFGKRVLAPGSLLLGVLLLGGCSSDRAATSNVGGQALVAAGTGSGLSGTAELSPSVQATSAPAVLVDGSGTVLARTTTANDGTFSFAGQALPSTYEVQVTAPDGTLLRSRSADPTQTSIEVDLLTTIVANWVARHPEKSLADATTDVLDYLTIPEDQGTGLSEDGPHSDFDPDIFVSDSANYGGVQAFINSLLSLLDRNGGATATFRTSSTGQTDYIQPTLQVMFANLAGPEISNGDTQQSFFAVDIAKGLLGPIAGAGFNWALTKLGFNDTFNTANKTLAIVTAIQQTLNQLVNTVNDINNVLANVHYEVVKAAFNQEAATLSANEGTIDNAASDLSRLEANPTFAALDTSRVTFSTSRQSLALAMSGIYTNLVGGGPRVDGGALASYLTLVNSTQTLNQAQLDGETSLAVREQTYQVRGLNSLIEQIHNNFDANEVNDASLVFDQNVQLMKQAQNQVVQSLELNGTAAVSVGGRSNETNNWGAGALSVDVLRSLANNGLDAPSFSTTLTAATGVGSQVTFPVQSISNIRVGSAVIVDTRSKQETLIVTSIQNGSFIAGNPSFSHAAGVRVLGRIDSPITNPFFMLDKDANLSWYLRPDPPTFGLPVNGNFYTGSTTIDTVPGWRIPTVVEVQHLLTHAKTGQGDAVAGLAGLGFRTQYLRSAILALASTDKNLTGYTPVDLKTAQTVSPSVAGNRIWVRDLPEGLASLSVFSNTNLNALVPGSSVQLFANGITATASSTKVSQISIGSQCVWRVVGGPRISDPTIGNQPTYDAARLRISNVPGLEGLLTTRSLPGDTANSPPETYVVQAQLGSVVTNATVTVTPSAPVGRLLVSDYVQQERFTAPGGVNTVKFKCYGRFTPQPTLNPANGAFQIAPDVNAEITSDPNLVWGVSYNPDFPGLSRIASIRVGANGFAELSINRLDPNNPIPAGGVRVSIFAFYTGSNLASPTIYPRAKGTVLVTN